MTTDRSSPLRVVPSSRKEWHALERRIIICLSVAFLLYMALTPGEWGDKATLIQAFSAMTLIWATYQSIRRSDDQIEAAQAQIEIASQQLDVSVKSQEKHHLSCTLDDELKLVIANLSTLPIQINRVVEFAHGRDGHIPYPELSNKILCSGESVSIPIQLLIDNSVIQSAKDYAGAVHVGEEFQENPLENYGLAITYRYGGTGGRIYEKRYKFGVMINTHTPAYSLRWPYVFFLYFESLTYTLIRPNGRFLEINVDDDEAIAINTL